VLGRRRAQDRSGAHVGAARADGKHELRDGVPARRSRRPDHGSGAGRTRRRSAAFLRHVVRHALSLLDAPQAGRARSRSTCRSRRARRAEAPTPDPLRRANGAARPPAVRGTAATSSAPARRDVRSFLQDGRNSGRAGRRRSSDHRRRLLVVRRPLEQVGHAAPDQLDPRRLAMLVLCVPLALAVFKLAAIIVISILAIVALFFVFRERRKRCLRARANDIRRRCARARSADRRRRREP